MEILAATGTRNSVSANVTPAILGKFVVLVGGLTVVQFIGKGLQMAAAWKYGEIIIYT